MSRTPPPPLILSYPFASPPLCPLCLDTVVDDGHTALCASCDALWQSDTAAPGQWLEPDAPTCPALCRPYRHNPHAHQFGARNITWQCSLADGHDEWHRTPNVPGLEWDGSGHAHTYMPGLATLDTTTGQPCECDIPIGSDAR